jgi:transposase-like protein
VEQADGHWWFKYSPEFKRQAVDRMMAGESVTLLAKELGVERKFFYAWREAGYGSAGPQPPILLRRRWAKERREARERQEAQEREKANNDQGLERHKAPSEPKRAGPRAVERQKKRILQLEQLVGRQAAELDFFAAALRNIEESRPMSVDDSGNESTPRSKPPRKAR